MKNSKKIGVAAVVIIGFALYSWHANKEASQSQVTTSQTATSTSGTSSASKTTTASSSTTTTAASTSTYKDGSYTGSSADAYYGYIQVKATISGGKLTDVEFLQYPNDQHESIEINTNAMPILKQEAIQAQTSQVDGVSGATDTSQAFVQSLNDALTQARS